MSVDPRPPENIPPMILAKTAAIFVGCFFVIELLEHGVGVVLESWFGFESNFASFPATLIGIATVWLAARMILGRLRRGIDHDRNDQGIARGLDAGAVIWLVMGSLLFAGMILASHFDFEPTVATFLALPCAFLLLKPIMPRFGRWLRQSPCIKPGPPALATVWDRELDG